jgi:hypothetical protein
VNVEIIIGRLKNYGILQGMKIEKIPDRERMLDNCCAQENLKELSRQGRLGEIPARARCPPNSHVFSKDLEPALRIPTPKNFETSTKVSKHVTRTVGVLKGILPKVEKLLGVKVSVFAIFFCFSVFFEGQDCNWSCLYEG